MGSGAIFSSASYLQVPKFLPGSHWTMELQLSLQQIITNLSAYIKLLAMLIRQSWNKNQLYFMFMLNEVANIKKQKEIDFPCDFCSKMFS